MLSNLDDAMYAQMDQDMPFVSTPHDYHRTCIP